MNVFFMERESFSILSIELKGKVCVDMFTVLSIESKGKVYVDMCILYCL